MLLGLIPLASLEMYLRVSDPVDSQSLAKDPIFDTSKQTKLFVAATDPSRLHIPDSRLNFFRPAEFAHEKDPNSHRVFVLGGSTVQGRPYETETSFPKWAELWLRAAAPQAKFEVINCGGVSYASYRVAIILNEVLEYAPDAIVLYTGHNEFLEERSYGDARVHPLERWAGRSRVVQRTRNLLWPAAQKQTLSADAVARLDLAEGLKRYVRDESWRRGVESHFKKSFASMIAACREAEVELVTCVPVGDIVNTPPFKIAAGQMTPQNEARFNRAWTIATDGERDQTQRIESCRNCLALDSNHAGAHFVLGKILWDRGDLAEAASHLAAARDCDVCPLRATTPIIDAVESLSRANGLAPVRCDQLLDQFDSKGRAIPDGVADPHRFVDHIHPSIAGHQMIGKAVAGKLLADWGITPIQTAESRFEQLAQEHLETLDETYFARADQRLRALQDWAGGRTGKLSLPQAATLTP